MDTIKQFCEQADRISINTSSMWSDTNVLNIDINKDEIQRTRYNKDLTCFFNLDLNLGDNITVEEEIEIMNTIETYYNDIFSWRFNGQHIECYAIIPFNTELLGIFSRYRGVYGFISHLRQRLLDICKFRGSNVYLKKHYIEHMMLADGSINASTDLYVVPITPFESVLDILSKSKTRVIVETPIKELNMRYWIREINPDFDRGVPQIKQDKMSIGKDVYLKYPPCIINLSKLQKKGNFMRYLLSTYLLAVHGERDAKHQMLTMLSDEEREHVESGNCKDQWRAIVSRNYPSPSCKKMFENGLCTEPCGRPCPSYQPQS